MIAPAAPRHDGQGASQPGEPDVVREAYALLRDLLRPAAARYWVDFLATIAVAYAAFAVVLGADRLAVRLTAGLVAALAAYRAAVFTHEIAHRPHGSFRAFTAAWNALCGIPFLMPSFLYGDHRGHHARPTYGTAADPEYLLRGARSRGRILAFLSLALVYPLFGPLRFLILTPLALAARPLDRAIWTYASSLYNMNEAYRRPYGDDARAWSRWVQEVAASAWAWTLAGLVAAGTISWAALGQAYAVFALWMAVNQVRTLAAHRYGNRSGTAMSHLQQVRDTNTFSRGRWLPELWAPLGMRYHALHHLMPTLPYHAMAAAHRRLTAQLPPGSPYRATERAGLWRAVAEAAR